MPTNSKKKQDPPAASEFVTARGGLVDVETEQGPDYKDQCRSKATVKVKGQAVPAPRPNSIFQNRLDDLEEAEEFSEREGFDEFDTLPLQEQAIPVAVLQPMPVEAPLPIVVEGSPRINQGRRSIESNRYDQGRRHGSERYDRGDRYDRGRHGRRIESNQNDHRRQIDSNRINQGRHMDIESDGYDYGRPIDSNRIDQGRHMDIDSDDFYQGRHLDSNRIDHGRHIDSNRINQGRRIGSERLSPISQERSTSTHSSNDVDKPAEAKVEHPKNTSSNGNAWSTITRKHLIWAAALVFLAVVAAVIVAIFLGLNGGSDEGSKTEILTPTIEPAPDDEGTSTEPPIDVDTSPEPAPTEPPVPVPPTGSFEVKITASDAPAFSRFGNQVAIEGGTLAVAAVFDSFNGPNSGSIYVFSRGSSSSSWTQQSKLLPSDGGGADDWFGRSLVLDGDTLAVGANMDNNDNLGSVYVFGRYGATWTQQAKVTSSSGSGDDGYGTTLALSGGLLIVGANKDWANDDEPGAAYIYRRAGINWYEEAKLRAEDGQGREEYGLGLATDGHRVIVGAFKNQNDGIPTGSAYVYSLLGEVWTQEAKLTASDREENDEFGKYIAISGNTVVIACNESNENGLNSGAAYVFTVSGSDWDEEAKLLASDGFPGQKFGRRVAINGDTILVSAEMNEPSDDTTGSAYVYTRSGTTWTEKAKLSTGNGEDTFGSSLAVIDSNTFVVGADSDDDNGENSGSIYVIGL